MHLPRLAHHILDFVYPGTCSHCDRSCEGPAMLCDPCAANLEDLIHAPACPRCAMPLATDGAPCPYCQGRGLFPFDRIIRLGTFNDPLRKMIHQIKYHRRWGLGEHLIDRLLGTSRGQDLRSNIDVIVPVPLHFWRHISRGYNQAEILARHIARRWHVPVASCISRIRPTPSQTQFHSQSKRHENVRGAFALKNASKIRGQRILVVDDVTTTGATLKAVARCLNQASPATLTAAVLAIADPRRRDFQVI